MNAREFYMHALLQSHRVLLANNLTLEKEEKKCAECLATEAGGHAFELTMEMQSQMHSFQMMDLDPRIEEPVSSTTCLTCSFPVMEGQTEVNAELDAIQNDEA